MHNSKKYCTFAADFENYTIMEAALQREEFRTMDRPLIDPNWREKPIYSHEEFWNMAYKDLGSLYGMNDIRDAK